MSTDTPASKNPLQREGTSQDRRLPDALDTLYARLDDRDLFDYLDFVYKYSEIVRFHTSDSGGTGEGTEDLNWQVFFSCGIILLSHISRNSSVESNRIFKADLYDLTEFNVKVESKKIEKGLLEYFEKLTLWHSKFAADDTFKEMFSEIITDKYFTDLKEKLLNNRKGFLKGDHSMDTLIENYLYINSEIIRYFDGLVKEAEEELQIRLANDKFTPHVGLLLTFLNLFEKSTDNLNNMTGRHLRFYYEDILQVAKKDFVEDEAHILIQLAKNYDEYEICEGTLFKGGKDSNGNELLYRLTENFIAGKDTVSSVKSSFNSDGVIRAAQNALMMDGLEEPLPEDDPVWAPFKNTGFPVSRLGFAVSSPILRLKTGTKNIKFIFEFDNKLVINSLTANHFQAEYSTKNKWIPVNITSVQTDEVLSIEIELPPTADPVNDYSAVNMEDLEKFDTEWPVFKFTLTEEAHSKRHLIENNALANWSINVTVSGIKDPLIQNDNGLLKAEKPFMPFGALPVVGSQVYIGHSEIFSKNITTLSLNWDWVDEPSSIKTHYSAYKNSSPEFKVAFSTLSDLKWQDEKELQDLNKDDAFSSELNIELSSVTSFTEEKALKSFSNDLANGFVRLKLKEPAMAFGHKEYQKLFQEYAIKQDTASLASLEPAYTPIWENLTLGYTSTVSSSGGDEPIKLFSLEEFGHKSTSKLLIEPYTPEGRLFIGLENVKENSGVSLLLQFAEGTADPFSTATSSFKWFYLSNDGWQEFDEEDITKDTTEDLLQSGIVRFAVEEFSLSNRLMPDGLTWLKLETYNDPGIFNDFISIRTQATTVKFQNFDNTLEHLRSALPAGSIAKLKIKDPAVKAVSQPFASFGGSPEENEERYNVRVSERLRHKDRAVQIWDYERLVLQQFPEIYKVKCLNHTGRLCTEEGETKIKYSEVSPGDVTLVAIPDLTNSERHNLARPAVKFATLKKIKEFLEARCSKWVNLEVRNPKYEELNVSFKVKFYDDISNTGFYLSKLKEDINAFLTPWAYDLGRLTLGNRIYKSTVLNFVEERDYVDYLIDFDARLLVDGVEKTFEEEITPSSSLSLIVPGTNHDINILTE